jgi:hypothetical protein
VFDRSPQLQKLDFDIQIATTHAEQHGIPLQDITSSSNSCNVPMICVDSATSAAPTCRELATSSEATANERASPIRRRRDRRRYYDHRRADHRSLARTETETRAAAVLGNRCRPRQDYRTRRPIRGD